MRGIRTLTAAAGMMVVLAGTAVAQRNWTGQVNAGAPIAMGKTGDVVTGQFSWGAGVRYSPADAIWGLRLDVRNSRFDAKNSAIQPLLDKYGATDGYARTWDFTLQGEVGMPKEGKFRVYAIGGVGYYNRYAALTNPTLVGGCYWDPWWGYICGSGVADEIVVKKDTWDFGVNGGAGISLNVGRGASIFVEGVYNVMFTKSNTDNTAGSTGSGSNTEWLPFYIGVRF